MKLGTFLIANRASIHVVSTRVAELVADPEKNYFITPLLFVILGNIGGISLVDVSVSVTDPEEEFHYVTSAGDLVV